MSGSGCRAPQKLLADQIRHRFSAPGATLRELYLNTLIQQWPLVCDAAGLSPIERRFLWKRQFLNESIFDGLDEQTRRRLPTSDC